MSNPLAEDDTDLFRRAMSGAKPLPADERAAPSVCKPKPGARFSRADEMKALRESRLADVHAMQLDDAESLHFCRPSIGRRTMRKLARGGYSVRAEIDLHGMTAAEAKPRLADFIDHCASNGQLCVRIVHGKGHGSGQRGPVLKRGVSRWLQHWDAVLAFVSARQVDGGTGAVYVLLQRI